VDIRTVTIEELETTLRHRGALAAFHALNTGSPGPRPDDPSVRALIDLGLARESGAGKDRRAFLTDAANRRRFELYGP
jgi:hypothetical protein